MEREADAERRESPRPAAKRGSDLWSGECGEAKSARRQRRGAWGVVRFHKTSEERKMKGMEIHCIITCLCMFFLYSLNK